MKEMFFAIQADKAGFEVIRAVVGEVPRGLTAELLWDLWDICVKFGQPSEQTLGFRFGESGLVMSAHNAAQRCEGGVNGLSIAKASCQRFANISNPTLLELRNGMNVLWDGALDPASVAMMIGRSTGLRSNAAG